MENGDSIAKRSVETSDERADEKTGGNKHLTGVMKK